VDQDWFLHFADEPGPKGGGDKLPDCTRFLQLIGSLEWIATGTRPDIAFTVLYLGNLTLTLPIIIGCVRREFFDI